jgi:hypothetical protein
MRKLDRACPWWRRLRPGVSKLSGMSEEYLADAHAVDRGHLGIASLLHDLHRESVEDRQD